jgi:hypothetical protein
MENGHIFKAQALANICSVYEYYRNICSQNQPLDVVLIIINDTIPKGSHLFFTHLIHVTFGHRKVQGNKKGLAAEYFREDELPAALTARYEKEGLLFSLFLIH